jgi:type IV secretory pathway TraG/TraD family ATPase VirD4
MQPWVPLAMGLLAATVWQQSRGVRRRDTHRRGALIARRPASRWQPLRAWGGDDGSTLRLAGVRISLLDETKHFKLIGTTGTGKSSAICELLNQAFARGDRAVIADPDGGYLARFGYANRGDVVLNPFAHDSVCWDPFSELSTPYDADLLTSALIPTCPDPAAQEWRGYARTFIAALLRRCQAEGRRSASELWRLLAMASSDELRLLVAGTPAQPLLEPENVRMFGSVRAVAVSAMASLEHVQAQRAAAFSVRRWVRAGRGVLFIPYLASQVSTLRSIIAAWLRLAIFEAMSQPEGRDQRLWFVMDELDALGAIDGLKDALARLRKFGGRCVVGFQSVAQVSSTYGQGDAQTIVENCANTLILRCSGSDQGGTSLFASRLIGEREVMRRSTSRGREADGSLSPRSMRRSVQVSEQQLSESAVLAAELEQLPDLCGYFKTPSTRGWCRVRLRYPD